MVPCVAAVWWALRTFQSVHGRPERVRCPSLASSSAGAIIGAGHSEGVGLSGKNGVKRAHTISDKFFSASAGGGGEIWYSRTRKA